MAYFRYLDIDAVLKTVLVLIFLHAIYTLTERGGAQKPTVPSRAAPAAGASPMAQAGGTASGAPSGPVATLPAASGAPSGPAATLSAPAGGTEGGAGKLHRAHPVDCLSLVDKPDAFSYFNGSQFFPATVLSASQSEGVNIRYTDAGGSHEKAVPLDCIFREETPSTAGSSAPASPCSPLLPRALPVYLCHVCGKAITEHKDGRWCRSRVQHATVHKAAPHAPLSVPASPAALTHAAAFDETFSSALIKAAIEGCEPVVASLLHVRGINVNAIDKVRFLAYFSNMICTLPFFTVTNPMQHK
jgi:hypothetical protein